MGVIYKIRPEVKDFILGEKKANPKLSCRGLVDLVEGKFQLKLSKSSINSLFKEASLSMPVGRRLRKRKYTIRDNPPTPEVIISLPAPVEPRAIIAEKPTEEVLPAPPLPAEPIPEVPVVGEVPEKPVEISSVEIETPLALERLCSGALMLKAADYLIGGTYQIAELLKTHLAKEKDDPLTQAKVEGLIYLGLFESVKEKVMQDFSGLWSLIDKGLSMDTLMSYLIDLKELRTINLDILRLLSGLFQEVRCVKVGLSNGGFFYLDGQLHTIWSTPYTPYDFSNTVNQTKNYLNKYFESNQPFVFFMAPGYDTPTKEFFDFILSMEVLGRYVSNLTLYGNRFEEISSSKLEKGQKRNFIFGLWPWQFSGHRQVKKTDEAKTFYSQTLKEYFHITEAEIELAHPAIKQWVSLRGVILRKGPNEKPRLIILSNLTPEQAGSEEILNLYLSRWPNLEEGFQDFSKKVELFTYTSHAQRFFYADKFSLAQVPLPDLNTLFKNYLEALDLYVKRHFLPSGYEDKDFLTIKEQFYSLPALLKKEAKHTFLTLQPPHVYLFLKDLQYAIRRINEREILFTDATRLWLSL